MQSPVPAKKNPASLSLSVETSIIAQDSKLRFRLSLVEYCGYFGLSLALVTSVPVPGVLLEAPTVGLVSLFVASALFVTVASPLACVGCVGCWISDVSGVGCVACWTGNSEKKIKVKQSDN